MTRVWNWGSMHKCSPQTGFIQTWNQAAISVISVHHTGPMEPAWELSKNWPEAELIVAPSSGHSAFEKEITHELVKATEEFAINE